jgi:hypothetical protein
MIYYSDSSKGFYHKEIHGNNIPEDCVEISKEEYNDLLKEIYQNNKQIEVVGGKISVIEKNKSVNKEELILKIAAKRNDLLSKSDWTILPDAPFTQEQQNSWREYRQALRDITEQEGYPETVVFPEPPTKD